jgi:hypothetical protein
MVGVCRGTPNLGGQELSAAISNRGAVADARRANDCAVVSADWRAIDPRSTATQVPAVVLPDGPAAEIAEGGATAPATTPAPRQAF